MIKMTKARMSSCMLWRRRKEWRHISTDSYPQQ